MRVRDVDAVFLSSMHSIAYYSGFLMQLWPILWLHSHGGRLRDRVGQYRSRPTWTTQLRQKRDLYRLKRDNFWRAVRHVVGSRQKLGIESDHLTLAAHQRLETMVNVNDLVDLSGDMMKLRMIKSDEEIRLIREGARIADVGDMQSATPFERAPGRLISL